MSFQQRKGRWLNVVEEKKSTPISYNLKYSKRAEVYCILANTMEKLIWL